MAEKCALFLNAMHQNKVFHKTHASGDIIKCVLSHCDFQSKNLSFLAKKTEFGNKGDIVVFDWDMASPSYPEKDFSTLFSPVYKVKHFPRGLHLGFIRHIINVYNDLPKH